MKIKFDISEAENGLILNGRRLTPEKELELNDIFYYKIDEYINNNIFEIPDAIFSTNYFKNADIYFDLSSYLDESFDKYDLSYLFYYVNEIVIGKEYTTLMLNHVEQEPS